MTISQLGLSSNEMPLATCVLAALALLVPVCAAPLPRAAGRRVLLAGFLCGLAAGLKPTAIIHVPALGLALLLATHGRGVSLRFGTYFAVAAATGFLLAYGWWGWELYRLTGNPVFPLFNQVFHSDWVPATGGTDRQFMPRNLWQWLLYPWFWLSPRSGLVTETTFADPRYALAMLALVAAGITAWRRRMQRESADRATTLLVAFVVLAYGAWLGLFSILRYALPIEALTGLLLWLAVLRWLPAASTRVTSTCMLFLFVLLAGFTRYPSWGHVAYASRAFAVDAPGIAPDTLVLVIDQPLAYVIPFLPQATSGRYVGLTWFNDQAADRRLGRLTRQAIRDHAGPVRALLAGEPEAALAVLRRWAPTARIEGPCQPVTSALERGARRLWLCDVHRE